MILLSRLNGAPFALNPDLIERAEETPDTVITLCDGHKVIVAESVAELVARGRDYRAHVIAAAERLDETPMSPPALHVVPLPAREQ